MTQRWGFGNPTNLTPFDSITLHGRQYDLLFGEHPHSRSDNNIYARSPEGRIEEFSGHRRTWGIKVNEENYLKESSLSGDEIRQGGSWELSVDGEVVFSGFCRSLESGIAQAQRKKSELIEVANGDWLTEKRRLTLIGRPIFYDRTPAVITRLIVDQGCVMIEPAKLTDSFSPPVWEENPEDWLSEHARSIKAEITSPHIWWWRKESK